MGSTRRNQQNTTTQTDARQIHETMIDYEYRLEDSFNTTNDYELRDESQGNVSAGGNVTIESEAASIAASQAAADAAEKAAEESRRIAEVNADLQAQLAEEQRRATEAAAKLEEERARANAQIAAANAASQQKLAEEQRKATEEALKSNTSVANTAISETRKASEDATKSVVEISKDAISSNNQTVNSVLSAGQKNLEQTFKFLQEDEREDRELLSENFEFLGDTIKDANALTTTAVTEAFKSTIGGLADEQQKTLLIGLAIIAVLIVIMSWRKS